MKFRDIKQLTRSSNYSVTTDWKYLENTLKSYGDGDTKLDLDPEFQRAHVWNEHKQVKYVEYILRGGKSSRDIYWNCNGWMGSWKGPMYLVDGKQRLESVRKFMRNDLAIFGGYKLLDFSDSIRIVSPSFTFHVNDLESYKEVLQWYIDLNDGGIAHTKEEIDKVKSLLETAS